MTLRDECEAFLTKYGLGGLKSQAYEEAKQESTFIQDLERLCLKQQAVGLREAAKGVVETEDECTVTLHVGDDNYPTDHYAVEKFAAWCEQRAREREGNV